MPVNKLSLEQIAEKRNTLLNTINAMIRDFEKEYNCEVLTSVKNEDGTLTFGEICITPSVLMNVS